MRGLFAGSVLRVAKLATYDPWHENPSCTLTPESSRTEFFSECMKRRTPVATRSPLHYSGIIRLFDTCPFQLPLLHWGSGLARLRRVKVRGRESRFLGLSDSM
jgi:hypothetical protein